MQLSIIMPVYNEENTVADIIRKILDLKIDFQLIIVDNGSSDKTGDIIRKYDNDIRVKLIFKKQNIGKGDGIITGLEHAAGHYTVIQDGDLEYDPADLEKMLAKAEATGAIAVFGSRRLNPDSGISYNRYLWGGQLLTLLANLLFGVSITDESTCYKMIRTDILKRINLESRRFEFCPEVVAKLGRNRIRISEIPVSYHPRKFDEGKKIRWNDGLEAIWTLIKYRFKSVPDLGTKQRDQ
jgi:glycosyltransferase involved in cell wall biosynthesis